MDTERSGEVLDASETPQQDQPAMEKEVVSKLETPEESTAPEKPPAAEAETEQPAVNGHDKEVMDVKEMGEMAVTPSEDKKETESVPGAVVAPPEPDESSEKISDPEPENTEQPPVPENDPEPLVVQTPLAESAPEPEPEKSAESVPEAELQEQTLPEKATADTQVEAEREAKMEAEKEEVSKEVEAAGDVAKEEVKPAESVVVTEVSPEKPTEAPAPAEPGDAKPVESDTVKAAEAAAEGEAAQSEPEKEEDTVPASGSLSFALLEQEPTKDALKISRTLVVVRGLPGSGKSFLARAIADAYKDHCSLICADDHDIKPENPESSADGYKALDEAVVARCSEGPSSAVLIVVDDTNHTQDRLARLGEIAELHNVVTLYLEPQTEWSRDVTQLIKKSRRRLEVVQLEAMKIPLEEMSLPLFFGWFLLSSAQDKVKCTAMDFLKTLDTLEAFKKHLIDFTGNAEKEVDLEQYFQAKGALHCTTKFTNYGKAEGAKEYAQNPAVKDLYGSAFELSLSALFVTPRTVGARVSLSEDQLRLWPADAEKEAASSVPAAASLPLGSRAHVTLGCAQGVEPVQTGFDLLEILALQQEGQQGELVEEMELGSLTYYGQGRWLLSLREPIGAPACFSSFYGRKEVEPTKKEPEKKKKAKCTLL